MFECLPCSDYYLTVNHVRGHHFQNEFYWLDVVRYFVNPYSCSSKVHRRLEFFFHSLNWWKIGHRGDDQNLLFICAKINVSLVSIVPCSEGGRKTWKLENLSFLEWRIRCSFQEQFLYPIHSPNYRAIHFYTWWKRTEFKNSFIA